MTAVDNRAKRANDVQRIVGSLPLLVAVVEKTVKLDAHGFGICPFHKEDTPSFHVFQSSRSSRARYYCFGCNAKGDIFDYISRIHGMDFNTALVKLSSPNVLDQLPVISPSLEPAKSQPDETLRSLLDISVEELTEPEPKLPDDSAKTISCESDCPRYAEIREDYDLLLGEYHSLRAKLNIGDFQPSVEKTPVHVDPIRGLEWQIRLFIHNLESEQVETKVKEHYNKIYIEALNMVLSWIPGQIYNQSEKRSEKDNSTEVPEPNLESIRFTYDIKKGI